MANDEQKGDGQKSSPHTGEHKANAASRGVGILGTVYNALMRGGYLQAFGRQGVDELAQAFGKALPDSIQANTQPGAMFQPLASDIEADREQFTPRQDLPSPSDIANDRNYTPAEQRQGAVNGRGTQYAMGGLFGVFRAMGKASELEGIEEPVAETAPRPSPAPAEAAGSSEGPPGGFVAREMERRAAGEGGNEQNAMGRGRSLPDEQRARDRGDRGR